jgi:H+-transporting ATPase
MDTNRETGHSEAPEPQFESLAIDDALRELDTDAHSGLTTEEAKLRLDRYGPNAIQERHISPIRRLLLFFWGPIAWMIEAAAVLSAVARRWEDFVIIVAMLLINAGVGFWEEFKADNAIEALKQRLALGARTLRDGRWVELAAAELVPGDIVELRLGNIVPADCKLIDGDYLTVDQSALTGESLPVDKKQSALT